MAQDIRASFWGVVKASTALEFGDILINSLFIKGGFVSIWEGSHVTTSMNFHLICVQANQAKSITTYLSEVILTIFQLCLRKFSSKNIL